jgi:hypothetical protein
VRRTNLIKAATRSIERSVPRGEDRRVDQLVVRVGLCVRQVLGILDRRVRQAIANPEHVEVDRDRFDRVVLNGLVLI